MCITHAKQKRKNHRGCVIRPERPMFLLFYECHLSKMIRNFYAFFLYHPTDPLFVWCKNKNLERLEAWRELAFVFKERKKKKKKKAFNTAELSLNVSFDISYVICMLISSVFTQRICLFAPKSTGALPFAKFVEKRVSGLIVHAISLSNCPKFRLGITWRDKM